MSSKEEQYARKTIYCNHCNITGYTNKKFRVIHPKWKPQANNGNNNRYSRCHHSGCGRCGRWTNCCGQLR